MLTDPATPGAPFAPSVKLEARRLAAFKCCYCREGPGDDVHHIVAKEHGGLGVLENAILLCAQCHRDYGDRKDKQLQLRQARDDWYDIVARRWTAGPVEINSVQDLGKKNAESIRLLKATKFLLEKPNRFYKNLVEHLSGTVDNAAPVLINSATFEDVVTTLTGRPPREKVFSPGEVKAALDVTFGRNYKEQSAVVFFAGMNPITDESAVVIWGTDEDSGALLLRPDAFQIMRSLHRNLRRLLSSSPAS